jgi:uncharacterized repeat protein (TIGR03803 family)
MQMGTGVRKILGALKTRWDGKWQRAIAGAFVIAFMAAPLHAQFTYWDRYDFSCACSLPCEPHDIAELAQGLDGNLYGTTIFGGAHDFGIIFMVTPTGSYTDLWDFDGVTGEGPLGGLTLAPDGNFYGSLPAVGLSMTAPCSVSRRRAP